MLRISNSSNANAGGASPGGIAGSKREPHLGLGDSNLNLISENGYQVQKCLGLEGSELVMRVSDPTKICDA